MLRIVLLLLFITSIGDVIAQDRTDEHLEQYYKINSQEIPKEYYRLIRRNSPTELIVTPKTDYKSVFNNLESLSPVWKLSPSVRNNSNDKASFLIQVNDAAKFKKRAETLGLSDILYDERSATFLIETRLSVIETEIGHDNNVIFIESAKQKPIDEASIRLHDLALNGISYAQNKYPTLRGEPINISIKERSVLPNDIDLINRSFETEFTDTTTSLHATEMATLIAGAGNSFITGKGVADAARITSTNYYSLLPEVDAYFLSNNISVQNHSYGVEIANYYGIESQAYDKLHFDNPALVTVFSAGNSGMETSSEGLYKDIVGYANITGSFKQAKNNILVGAVDTTLSLPERTSKGPAYDGRIKPELVAFGGEGTSEAAALVTGSVGLLQENYYREFNSLPSSSLIKACLIATAEDVGPDGVDYASGYGSLNLIDAIESINEAQFFEGILEPNDEKRHTIIVPENCAGIRLALTWIDPPANPMDYQALLNDLDLIVEHTGSGQSWRPWILDPTADVAKLSGAAIRGIDTLNNVEFVSIDLPASGVYNIIIKSTQLITETQNYSFAYHFKRMQDFRWLTPVQSTKLETEEPHYLRWQSSYQNVPGDLEISYGDDNWELLSAAVDLSSKYYQFTPKDTISTAILRMKVVDQEYYSDTFTISPVPKLGVAFNCNEDALLTWIAQDEASGYELFALKDHYQENITSTEETEYLIIKENQSSQYFSLALKVDEKFTGIRGRTINYEEQAVGCYIDHFNAFINLNDEAEVSLVLGSDYNLKEVALEKISSLQVKSSLNFTDINPLNYVYIDENLDEGINYYQTSIFLNDDREIRSDSIAVVFFEQSEAFVFPNPLASGQGLNIITDTADPVFQLLDTQGNLVFETEFSGSSDFIYFDQLRSGLYIYRIFDQDQVIATSRLIIVQTSN